MNDFACNLFGEEEPVTCAECIYGRNIGGNDWGCLSERRRMDNQLLVHNLSKEKFTCEYAERLVFGGS